MPICNAPMRKNGHDRMGRHRWQCDGYRLTAGTRNDAKRRRAQLNTNSKPAPEPEPDASQLTRGTGIDWNEFHTNIRHPNTID